MASVGRPLGFDEAETLEAIQERFWNGGYSATSLDDLMSSTGLSKGSLYGRFGSKHDMFVLALSDYCAWAIEDYEKRLRGPAEGASARLRALIRNGCRRAPGPPRGCMLAKSTAELAGRFTDVDELIARTFKAMEDELYGCVRQAQVAGDVDGGRDARTLAVTLLAVLRGVESLKKAGAPPATLARAARGAVELLGTSPRRP